MDELHESDLRCGSFFDYGSRGLESGRCATEDESVLVREEEVREDEDSHDVLWDGHLILRDEMVDNRYDQF